VALTSFGCEEDKPLPTTPTTTATAKPTARATATATASAAAASAKQGNMTHCPNAVEGATTEIKDTKEGVEILVTAKDDKATKDIRDRAKHLVDAAKADAAAATPKHTGEGQGGGQFGRCPVVMKNTTVEAKEIPGGTQITVKANEAKEADWLRREAKERQAELAEPGGKDAGQRRMANCPSAALGATTTVKEAAGAVEVTVTAKDEAGTKDIRDRAKKIVEAAKIDPTDVKHSGDGKGGGGLGRCPVVLKDSTVEAKDVPGGSVFTVKPKKPADLAALVKESKERAETLATAPAGTAAATAAPTGAATASPTGKPTGAATGAPKPAPPG
jgi:TusA-related sulfurtransferase